jgi:hypothetical protein
LKSLSSKNDAGGKTYTDKKDLAAKVAKLKLALRNREKMKSSFDYHPQGTEFSHQDLKDLHREVFGAVDSKAAMVKNLEQLADKGGVSSSKSGRSRKANASASIREKMKAFSSDEKPKSKSSVTISSQSDTSKKKTKKASSSSSSKSNSKPSSKGKKKAKKQSSSSKKKN